MPEYFLETWLRSADLMQIARDKGSSNLKNTKISGTADAKVRLDGDQRGVDSLKGLGQIVLYDANIYEVPAMLAMLKLLKFKEPDTTAFTTSNMDFRVHGEDIYFDRIDFSGDSISLRGHGRMNLDTEIDFNFYTIVGRSEFVIPLISPLLGLASRQFLRIQIDGTLGQPNPPLREVLPGLSDALRQLFPELEDREPLTKRPKLMSTR